MPSPALSFMLPLAALALAACQPPPNTDADADTGAEPTQVDPLADPHATAGNAVPRDEADPGETPPPAKGGY